MTDQPPDWLEVIRTAPKHLQSGVWHVKVPGHPLARRDGWAPLGRVALYEYVGEEPVCEGPNCRGTNLRPNEPARLVWGRGRGMGSVVVDGERRPRLVVWYRDGDRLNLSRENLRAACPSCVARTLLQSHDTRGDLA